MFHRAKHLVQKSFFNKQMGKKNAFPQALGLQPGMLVPRSEKVRKGQPQQPSSREEPEHRCWALPVIRAHFTSL